MLNCPTPTFSPIEKKAVWEVKGAWGLDQAFPEGIGVVGGQELQICHRPLCQSSQLGSPQGLTVLIGPADWGRRRSAFCWAAWCPCCGSTAWLPLAKLFGAFFQPAASTAVARRAWWAGCYG